MTEQKSALHKCRDCQTTVFGKKVRLCTHCKAAAAEKRKARKRETAHERYRPKSAPKKPAIPLPPHPCATAGCDTLLEGRAVYCAACHHNSHIEPRPAAPPTSLAWLDKFHAWSNSGQSYAAYQKQEWLNGGTPSRP